ncbi:MAG: hypothetical protein IPI67_09385 [Myxococcales bacterium]|nr:hypothetical protein [Myxococcales bacterium]
MSKPPGFLLALDLSGKRCLVLGSSDEAARRAENLALSGAVVVAIASEPCAALELMAKSPGITLERRAFSDADLDSVWLVVLADRDAELAGSLGAVCARRRILFCAIDQPGQNSYDHVAVARAGSITLAVSSSGTAPALAKRLRDELSRVASAAGLAEFADTLAKLRESTPREQRKAVLTEAAARLSITNMQIAGRPPDEPDG